MTTKLSAPHDADRIEFLPNEVLFYRHHSVASTEQVTPGDEVEISIVAPTGPTDGTAPDPEMVKAVNETQRVLMSNVARASRSTMRRIGASFTGHFFMNVLLFAVGLGSFGLAVYKGLADPSQSDAIVSAAFGGLTAASFITYFVTKPMDSVAVAGPESAWLLSSVNTYWTKLVYLNDPVTFPEQVEKAQKEFEASMKAYVEAVAAHRAAVTPAKDEAKPADQTTTTK